jgi:hypothetical protein
MSILDDIFNIQSRNTEVQSTSPGDVLQASIAMSAHQLMENGFELTSPYNVFPEPLLNKKASIGINTALTLQSNYLQYFLAQKLKSIPFIPTADYAVNGGIKRGAKVTIEVVDESAKSSNAFSQLSRARQELSGRNTDIRISRLYFDKFSVMNVMESTEMRYQMHESFGADFINSLGQRPRMITLSGTVLNGRVDVSYHGQIVSMDWKNALQRFFDNDASLHQNALRGQKLRIFAQDTIYEGYAVNLVANTTAMDQGMSQVTMTIILKNKSYIQSNDGKIPGSTSDETIDGKDLNFPEPNFALYFTQDYSDIINKVASESKSKINAYLKTISYAAGNDNSTLINLNMWLQPSGETVYIYPAEGVKMHAVLDGTNLHNEILAFAKSESNSKNVLDTGENYYYYESVRNGYINRVGNINILALKLMEEFDYFSDVNALNNEA